MKWLAPILLLVASTAFAGNPYGPVPYDFAYDFGAGVLSNGEAVGIVSARTVTIPANTMGTFCTATAPAASTAAFTVTDTPYGSTPTTIATLTFASTAKICTLSIQAGKLVLQGDTIIITGPSTADATLAGVRITIPASYP